MLNIQLEQVLPSEIERRSFEIIGQELDDMGIRLDPEQELVIKRAIHTTADFEYAQNLVFSEHAIQKGIDALKQGATIITDTNMGWSGVNKKKLASLGGEALCFMADRDVADQAAKAGTTRAVASMEKAAELFGNGSMAEPVPGGGSESVPAAFSTPSRPCIFAIGNAPTALIRLYELVKEGRIAPALIIGAPVGFVNVVQSKELILTLEDTPYIVARGRKGGSNVAAAICNALLYQI